MTLPDLSTFVSFGPLISSVGTFLSVGFAVFVFVRNQRAQRYQQLRQDIERIVVGSAAFEEFEISDKFFAIESIMHAEIKSRVPQNISLEALMAKLDSEEFRKGLNRAATAAILKMPEWQNCYDSTADIRLLSAKNVRVFPIFSEAASDMTGYSTFFMRRLTDHSALWAAWDEEESELRTYNRERLQGSANSDEISLIIAELYIDYSIQIAGNMVKKAKPVYDLLKTASDEIITGSDRRMKRLSMRSIRISRKHEKIVDEKSYLKDVVAGMERFALVLTGRRRKRFQKLLNLLQEEEN